MSAVSIVSLSDAQPRGRVSVNFNIGGGGYYGGGYYGGYNHCGYAVRPYWGVATGPIGYYGYPPGGNCGWNYYHQWRCW